MPEKVLTVWRETDPEVLAGLYAAVSEQYTVAEIIEGYGLTTVEAWLEWCKGSFVFAVSADNIVRGFVALRPVGCPGHWELHACRINGLAFGDACRVLEQMLATVQGWVHAWPIDGNAGARAALAICGFTEVESGHYAKAAG